MNIMPKNAHAYAFQLQFVCHLLEEVRRACYVKLSGATVIMGPSSVEYMYTYFYIGPC